MKDHAGAELVTGLSPRGLVRLYGAIIWELRRRNIGTTNDGPVGGYGEWLVWRVFGGQRQPNSNRDFDVLTPEGVKLQVKARWLPQGNELRQLSAIRGLEQQGFDFIVAVLFDLDFDVIAAYQIPYAAVARLTTRAARTNSQRLVLNNKVCRDPECIDITSRFKEMAAEATAVQGT